MSLSLLDLWKSMGLFAKGIVVVLFLMSLWSLTIMVQKWWALRAARRTILRRGVFLLLAGYLNLVVWSGDILRVYGVSLLLAAWLLRSPGRTLWAIALGSFWAMWWEQTSP